MRKKPSFVHGPLTKRRPAQVRDSDASPDRLLFQAISLSYASPRIMISYVPYNTIELWCNAYSIFSGSTQSGQPPPLVRAPSLRPVIFSTSLNPPILARLYRQFVAFTVFSGEIVEPFGQRDIDNSLAALVFVQDDLFVVRSTFGLPS